nr:sulfotransferase [Salinibacter ruber]
MLTPDFLVIGAARAGSTYLARNLATHPEVFIPKKKELHYFDRNFEGDWSQYQQQFADARPSHNAIGEATPTYMTSADIANRIHERLPAAKLIAILRDPVDRAYSHYWNAVAEHDDADAMTYEQKRQAYPFEKVLETRSRLVDDGLYAENLEPFIDHFGKEQLLVLVFEEVVESPHTQFQRVFRFLDVDDTFRSPLVDRRINSSSQKHGRSSLLLRLYNFATAYVRIPYIAKWIENVNEVSYPPMDGQTRAELEKRFQRPNQQLEQLLGRSLNHWSS